MSPGLAETATAILERARPSTEQAEVFASEVSTTSMRWLNGELEYERLVTNRGVGLRVVAGDRYGYSYSSALDPAGVETLVGLARDAAAANRGSAGYRLPPRSELPVPVVSGLCHPAALGTTTADRHELPARVAGVLGEITDAAAPPVRVQRMLCVDNHGRRSITSSTGVAGSYQVSGVSLWIELLTDGRSSHAFANGRSLWDLDLRADLGAAVARLARTAGPPQPAEGVATIVLSPPAAASLIGAIVPALTGEAVRKGHSHLAGSLGRPIAGTLLTIDDDPLDVRGMSARPFDDEGTPSAPLRLLDCGILTSFLHNYATGLAGGTESTGHAFRSSYRSTPEVAPTNLVVRTGKLSTSELVRAAEPCLYVDEWHGGRATSSRAHTGRFSAVLSGTWWRGGGWAGPAEPVGVAGRIEDLLRRLVLVGAELGTELSNSYTVRTPALAFEGVRLSGRQR